MGPIVVGAAPQRSTKVTLSATGASRGARRVGRHCGVGVAERDPAQDRVGAGDGQLRAQHRGVRRHRRHRAAVDAVLGGGQQEVAEVDPDVEDGVGPEPAIAGQHQQVRRVEQGVVAEPGVVTRGLVIARDAHGLVQRAAAGAPVPGVRLGVLQGKRQLRRRQLRARRDQQRGGDARGRRRPGHAHAPGLGVAPRRRALGGGQDRRQGGVVDGLGAKAAAAVAAGGDRGDGHGAARRLSYSSRKR
ncbi:MAG: hypothetical protein R2939_00530 [Kofleriaceae bacterium]